jgi:DamX protein
MSSLSDIFSDSNRAFFPGAGRQVSLDEITRLCQSGNNLVVISGETGVGKSHLLSQARYQIAKDTFCCFIEANIMMMAEDIFIQILNQLEFSNAPITNNIDATTSNLQHAITNKSLSNLFIVIDDAHQLDGQVLSAIFTFLRSYQGQANLHFLIVGDSDFPKKLQQFEIRGVLAHYINLNPLNHSELREYLNFKLLAAGRSNVNFITERNVTELLEESLGLPALIDEIAPMRLFESGEGSAKLSDNPRKLPTLHLSLLAALLAALALALFYDGEHNLSGQKVVNDELTPDLEATDNKVFAGSSSTVINENFSQNPVQNKVSGSSFDESTGKDFSDSSAEKKGFSPSKSTSNPTASSGNQENTNATDQSRNIKVITKKQLENNVVSKTATAVDARYKEVSLPSEFSKDEEQVLSWPREAFTLQVVAASQRKSLDAFITGQPNQDNLHLVEIRRNNQPWYVVLTGVFESNELARRSIQLLPQQQVNTGPWVRKIANIQRSIEVY